MSALKLQIEKLRKEFADSWVSKANSPTLKPATKEEVIKIIVWARENGWRIMPIGQGTSITPGFQVPDKVIVMMSSNRNNALQTNLVDLAVVAEVGIPSARLSESLRNFGFRLDNTFADYKGSIGGLICGEKGISVRHLILGVEIIDGRGTSMTFGGRIRKNVCGFDIPGIFAGSRGTLGWLDRVYLRITPIHASSIGRLPFAVSPSHGPNRGLYQKVAEALDPDRIFSRHTL